MSKQYHIYATTVCPFCVRAINLLNESESEYILTLVDNSPLYLEELKLKYNWETIPIILELDSHTDETTFIGGYTDLMDHFLTPKVQEFWECLKNDPDRLIEIIKFTLKYEYFDERFFHYMQENFQTNIDVFVRSAQFYVLNRCTEDGQIFGGKFIDTKYINELAYFNIKNLDLLNLSVDMHEGASSLKIIETLQSDNYIVATPPGFSYRLLPAAQVDTLLNPNIDHAELASQLSTKNRWMIICNYHKKLEEIYNNYNINYFNEYWKESDPAAAKEMIIVKS